MSGRINTAIKRSHAPRSQIRLKLNQSTASRVTKNKIEILQAAGTQISDGFARTQAIQRDWRIQIVKSSQAGIGRQNQVGSRNTIRAVGGDHAHIGVV